MSKKESRMTKKIMKRIKSSGLKMKPRAYFVWGSVLLGMGLAGVFLLSVLMTGVLFFRLRLEGPLGYLRLGREGLGVFLRVFPWRLTGLTFLGLVGGCYLLKKQGKNYKIGWGWLGLGVIGAVLGAGFLADRAGLNEKLIKEPKIRLLYEMRFEAEDFVVGEVIGIEENKIILKTPGGKEVEVELTEETCHTKSSNNL